MVICVLCSESKPPSHFFRTDTAMPRCKECCKVSRFCDKCKTPKMLTFFPQKGCLCFDCKHGVFMQKPVPVAQDTYVETHLQSHADWLQSHGISENGIHM